MVVGSGRSLLAGGGAGGSGGAAGGGAATVTVAAVVTLIVTPALVMTLCSAPTEAIEACAVCAVCATCTVAAGKTASTLTEAAVMLSVDPAGGVSPRPRASESAPRMRVRAASS